tara:strand:+ start:355 stop:651 length:297 start_codon:yes stop_codon:yes gene_type:complete
MTEVTMDCETHGHVRVVSPAVDDKGHTLWLIKDGQVLRKNDTGQWDLILWEYTTREDGEPTLRMRRKIEGRFDILDTLLDRGVVLHDEREEVWLRLDR